MKDTNLQALKELEARAMKLKTYQFVTSIMEGEKTDIINKVEMIYKRIYPHDIIEQGRLRQINFKPMYSMEKDEVKPWNKGVTELVSYIDTIRLKYEHDLSEKKSTPIEPIIKEVYVEKIVQDTEEIDNLNRTITKLKTALTKKTLWDKIKWGTAIPICFLIGGGLFWFGYYIADIKHFNDRIKIEENTLKYQDTINNFKEILTIKKDNDSIKAKSENPI